MQSSNQRGFHTSALDKKISAATWFGNLGTVALANGKTAVVWIFRDREIWVGESEFRGRKRAILDALNSGDTRKRIAKMESTIAEPIVEREQREAERIASSELGIDLFDLAVL